MVYATGDEAVMGWQLEGFSSETGELVSEFAFGRKEFLAIRDLFDYDDDEWFTHRYLVTPDRWPRVEAVLGCGPPQEGVEYFIGSYLKDGTT